jgi:hypothetical protein
MDNIKTPLQLPFEFSQLIHFESMNLISNKLLRTRALEYVKPGCFISMTLT